MSDAQKAALGRSRPPSRYRRPACSTRSSTKAGWRATPNDARTRQEPGEGLRRSGAGGRDDGVERRRGDDQRAHRADRPPGLAAVERSPAPRELPEAGRHLARAEVPDGPERNQRQAEDQGPQRRPRRNCCATCNARRNSTRARCSRRSTKKSSASSAARRSRRWSATTNSGADPKISNCWRRFPRWRRRRMRRS